MDFAAHIRTVPDFPKPGILFRDITTLLADPVAFRAAIEAMTAAAAALQPDVIVGIESRGFVFGAPVAVALGAGFVPVRKPGKLPAATLRETYALEYGEDALEIHAGALASGARVVIVDDLLATGGTAAAAARLVERAGAVVAGTLFLVELAFLPGRAALAGRSVHALVRYDNE